MRFVCCALVLLLAAGCAPSFKNSRSQVNGFISDARLEAAIDVLSKGPSKYGSRNQLLYWLDLGMAQHLSGQYAQSAKTFEKAKRIFDELYTISVSQRLATYAINDNWESYRSDDFEFILINIFQAFNFAAMGQWDEAVVEARDVDHKLQLIAGRYGPTEKFVYRQDPAAQLLSGLLWESSQSFDDAYISYRKSYEGYVSDWLPHLNITVPDLLKEHLLYVSKKSAPQDYHQWQGLFPNQPMGGVDPSKGLVIGVFYTGFVPVKAEETIFVPTGDVVSRVSLPHLVDRYSGVASVTLQAVNGGVAIVKNVPVFYPIGEMARKVMESHKAAILAKAILRPMGKRAVEEVSREQMRQHGHDTAADIFGLVSSIYNIFSEKADLRSWQTLPNQICMTSLALEPGTWQIQAIYRNSQGGELKKEDLGSLTVSAGQRKLLVRRSYL